MKAPTVRPEGRTRTRRRAFVAMAVAVLSVVTIRGAQLSAEPLLIIGFGVPLILLAGLGLAQPWPAARIATRVAGVLCFVLAVPAMMSLGPALLIPAVLLLAASERPRQT